jgi:hypothetical protein
VIDDVTPEGLSTRGRAADGLLGARAADDFDRPAPARVYDYLLGGASHGEVDRALARDIMVAEPRIISVVRENRAFMRRAVDFLVDAGIDQFLDLGSGIPTMGSVGEVARRRRPATRVVHVDVDPVAAAHAEHLLAAVDGITTVRADLRDLDAVLGSPAVRDLIDLDRPVGLLMISVLQHVPDADRPADVITGYLRRLVPGSALAVSHLSEDDPTLDVGQVAGLARAYAGGGLTPRSRDEVAALMTGVDLVAPGLVWASEWHPEAVAVHQTAVCGHRVGVGFLPPRA